MPLVGGFDGVDVTVKNPFSNSVLATNLDSLLTRQLKSYCFNSGP